MKISQSVVVKPSSTSVWGSSFDGSVQITFSEYESKVEAHININQAERMIVELRNAIKNARTKRKK